MANENKTAKEYVQKGYLIAHLANCGIQTINYDEWERLCECIHEAKPADVAEVVHGEWIKTTIAEPCGTDELHMTIYRDRETVKCSECGNPSPIYNIEFEFCPRCGARMDGDK